MAFLLGIDLGTSYFKVGLFDATGGLRGLGRVAVEKIVPAPDRCELPIETFWATLRRGLREALAQAGATPREITALSYSSQASTFVLLDRAGAPLTPLIVWTDARGEPVEESIAAFAWTEAFRRRIGFGGLSGQSAVAKTTWFRRREPEVWARAAHVMTISDYLTFALTGERAGDASTAAFLGIYDLEHGGWWEEALSAFGLERAKLSTPLVPGSPCGRTNNRATELLGLPAGIPFAVGALDHHAAAIGSGLGALGDVSISTGTVLAALVLAERVQPIPGCYYGRHVDGRRFFRLAFSPDGAGRLEEYQRAHAPEHTIEALIGLASDGRAGHGRAVRALLARVCDEHARLVDCVLAGSPMNAVVATGGGSRSPLWLQIGADTLGVPVVTPACVERACLGAAIFAAVAAKAHDNLPAALNAMVHRDRVYHPRAALSGRTN